MPDIITPEERKAFLELSTNDERDQFRESFWERRNPDPESPVNSARRSMIAVLPMPTSIFLRVFPVGRPIVVAFTSFGASRMRLSLTPRAGYNLKVDETTHKSKVSVAYRVMQTKDQTEGWRAVESSDHLHQGGEQLAMERFIPVDTLSPGRYTIEVTGIDLLTNETVTRTSEFTVRPAPTKALVPLRPSLY